MKVHGKFHLNCHQLLVLVLGKPWLSMAEFVAGWIGGKDPGQIL